MIITKYFITNARYISCHEKFERMFCCLAGINGQHQNLNSNIIISLQLLERCRCYKERSVQVQLLRDIVVCVQPTCTGCLRRLQIMDFCEDHNSCKGKVMPIIYAINYGHWMFM